MMANILILSKNFETERPMEQALQLLGHEVFCSVSLTLNNYEKFLEQSGSDFLKYFPIVIFSETLSDDEVAYAIQKTAFQRKYFMRKSDQMVTQQIHGREILNIQTNFTLEGLRLLLEEVVKSKEMSNEVSTDIISDLNLSKTERKTLDYLIDNEGVVVERKLLCTVLWNEVSASRLSELSNITTRIKYKLKNKFGENIHLQTVWGKGYLWKNSDD